jgi:4-cresol dehydrogenase (hydroxylating) flavoprotein subunit
MSLTLPPTVSENSLAAALDDFVAALSPDRVLTSAEDLREFRDPFEPESWELYVPSAVVMPTTVEEVQAVVRIANEHAIPLWTHGQGRNNAYGGGAPRVKGAVTVSLRRMNKVLEINEELGYAVVEPGTSWLELYEAIQAGGHNLMMSCTDLGWGSVIGNALDHGLTYTPYGQDFMMPCGMEVVLGDGDLLRTGMGAMPGNPAWHVYKRGLGPTLDQLFMQSNFGIVTRMGVWLLPMPETFMAVWLRVWAEDDVVPLIDTLRRLRLDRTIEGVPVLYNTLLAAAGTTKRTDWYEGDDPIPDGIIDKIGRELGTGRFTLRCGLFGDEPVVDHNYAKIKSAFEQIPGAEVWSTKTPAVGIPQLTHPGELVAGGVPNMEANHQTFWYSSEHGGHIGASPVVPLTGEHFYRVHKLLRRTIEDEASLDYMVGAPVISARSLINIGDITYDAQDEDQARRAYDAAKLLVTRAAEAGYGEYRAHLDTMDLAQAHYSFNDNAYLRFLEKIKDAVDPGGILSPGKQGIWPRAMRTGSNGGVARGGR